MKKTGIIMMMFALVMAMTQCKKNEQAISMNDGVVITLDVNEGNSSRTIVNTTTGTVDFENGDQIIVASGGKYVGTLTHNGSLFSGSISNAVEGYPLYFYFIGNVEPVEILFSGTTETCSVVISDQTEHLPVISYAASNENFGTTTAFTAHLLNKCALVKFSVTTLSSSPICVTGMKNKLTVNFAQNTITPSQDGEGVIKLPAGSGENVEKWAILLPQEALSAGTEGSAYSEDGNYIGMRSAIPAITENGYLTNGILVTVSNSGISETPTGAINGLFTINSNGNKVYFSQGNLQYQASTNTWRFANSQYERIGSNNSNISPTYNGWIDLFGWGTSGYNHGANSYQPWSTSTEYSDYYAYSSNTNNLYDQNRKADWGYNPILNGSNQENLWRTLTYQEWWYLLWERATPSGCRFVKAIVDGISGIIILPDNWVSSIYNLNYPNVELNTGFGINTISASDWNSVLEIHGAVFLPVTGRRTNGTYVSSLSWGGYWASSVNEDRYAHCCVFEYGGLTPAASGFRNNGLAVRLVQDYNP